MRRIWILILFVTLRGIGAAQSTDTIQVFDVNQFESSENIRQLSVSELKKLNKEGYEILHHGNFYYWKNSEKNGLYCDGTVNAVKHVNSNLKESFCLACFIKDKPFEIQACIH